MEASLFNATGYRNLPLALLTEFIATGAQLRSSSLERNAGLSTRAQEPPFGAIDHFVAGAAEIGVRAGDPVNT
jgi:hypothetical protein